MKTHSALTQKGQITLPKPFRQAIGLQPGDVAAISLLDDHTIAIRVPLDIADIRQKIGQPSAKQLLTGKEQQRLKSRGLA